MSRGMKDLLAAAATGDATSQFNLAVVYENQEADAGKYGARYNRAEAKKWLLRAAHQGMAQAQIRLAEAYAADSVNAPRFRIHAYAWFLLAAAGLLGAHRQRAQFGYDRLARQMDSGEIEKADRLARSWKPKWQAPSPDDDDIAAGGAREKPAASVVKKPHVHQEHFA